MDPNVPSPHLPQETVLERASIYLKNHYPCTISFFGSLVRSVFPILSWLPEYRWNYLLSDVISGFSIVIMHVPQGMAYGLLASVHPQNGLYVSFFPVFIYCLLGTSKHVSVGTISIVSLMVSGAVNEFHASKMNTIEVTALFTEYTNSFPPTPLEIVTTLALEVGLLQVLMGIFRLGSLTVVFSDQLVSGLCTAAAFHVAISQLEQLFDIHVGVYGGSLKLLKELRDIFENLKYTNLATLLIAIVSISILIFTKEVLDVKVAAKLKMPIPIDLLIVLIATVVSYLADFNKLYDVSIMKNVSTGLPYPQTPRLDILHLLITRSLIIAVVAFAITLSMAKIFAKKHKYTISPNQELLALGSANIFSSFFACFPCCVSLSRSFIQEESGGKTQVASLVSCCLLLIVLLVLAPSFYYLPKCILSCIIIVALKGMLKHVYDLPKAWRVSKIDASVWIVTFLFTLLLDVMGGLLAGILYALLTVIFRTAIPERTFLGNIPTTDAFVDILRYKEAEEIKGIRIYHFEAALCFLNCEVFKSSLEKHIPLVTEELSEEKAIIEDPEKVNGIIIDCSSLAFVDTSGLEAILQVVKSYNEIGIKVYVADCSIGLYDKIMRSKFVEKVPYHPFIFLTIKDALQYHHSSSNNSD